ncbi:hypothetical protein NA57DRAFT_75372 [Rhizodiscina lignyota]|uniref:Uncharacterized protein n=1 Tax=Rhizodiscina lignyota TaxID=1504668 RepID=A0A9P4M9Z2_9PEZI|nr:hypothetical protein NA57DRAFT_75372 [Rhizodiscina lignyota]
MAVGQSKSSVEAKKKLAEDALREQLSAGQKLGGKPGVERILREKAELLELRRDFFTSVLTSDDYLDLILRVTDSVVPGQPSETLDPSIQLTPPGSDKEFCGGQAESSGSGIENSPYPTYNEKAERFIAKFMKPGTSDWKPFTACECQQRESFIREKFVIRNKLICDPDRTIELPWIRCSTDHDSDRTNTTRFKIVPEDKIKHDVAIGTAKSDDEDDDVETLIVAQTQDMTLAPSRDRSIPIFRDLGDPAEFAGRSAAHFFTSLKEIQHQTTAKRRQDSMEFSDPSPVPRDSKRARTRIDEPG